MVTKAGKELLKNTIQTVRLHNRIIEENEMWRQWELERGLTMMVSDHQIKKRRREHNCSYHMRKKKLKEKLERKQQREKIAKAFESSTNSSSDRWDHEGFKELYPEECKDEHSSSSSSDEMDFIKNSKKRKKHVQKKDGSSSSLSSSDEEVWSDYKEFKRKLHHHSNKQVNDKMHHKRHKSKKSKYHHKRKEKEQNRV